MLRKIGIGAGVVAIAMVLGPARIAYAGGEAPTAVPDNAQTFANTPVDIDELANDQIPPGFVVDSVFVETDPAHGTASINGDNTVHYEPAPDYTGPDQMEYSLEACPTEQAQKQVVAQPHQGEGCEESIATIDILVNGVDATTAPPPSTTVDTSPPVIQGSTAASTTVAANELPKTGAGSVPFGWGIAALVVGLASLGLARTRRRD